MYSIYKVLVSHNGLHSGMHIRVLTSDIRTILMAQAGYLKLVEHEPLVEKPEKPRKSRRKVTDEPDRAGQAGGSEVRAAGSLERDSAGGDSGSGRVEEDGTPESGTPVGIG
jgi:hypothetical protein